MTYRYKTKIDNYIDFPLYDLDFTAYMIDRDTSNSNVKYDLYGIIVVIIFI